MDVIAVAFGEHRVDADGDECVGAPLRDGDTDLAAGRLVDGGAASHPPQTGQRGRPRGQQAGVDELVEVEGGELAGDADGLGGFLPGPGGGSGG
ncbi:hypothetical protein [Gandjariella thermophila]|uniref:Uncharacterized protein n=1 Tax=Gandjariella thermophila TaxID=1931992 RepID=A0A4D4JJ36_9PSEU|nr:hypothetical protein [Gandjariella thermophila]GDY33917.1 hypothetical protein GTS_55500 [Gandjariella thermophila]